MRFDRGNRYSLIMKTYDRAYFDRWYRHPLDRVATRDSLERKVRLAVSVAEFVLGRELRTVLDVGCGEAPWFPVLKRLRRDVRYIGVESSEYAVARYGEARNIRRGTLDELGSMRLPKEIDLIVCADVLQYVDDRGVERGLRAIRKLLGGVAYIETFTTADAMEGDRDGWYERTAAEYRRLFRDARLTHCGPYCYLDLDAFTGLNDFEHC
jgi:SAM-dependent methyltransferase